MRKQFFVEVLEGNPSVHAHYLVAVDPEVMRLIGKLPNAPKFAQHDHNGSSCIDVRLANRGRCVHACSG